MSPELQERVLKAKNIASLRWVTRQAHISAVLLGKGLSRRHQPILSFLGFVVGFGIIFLPVDLFAKIIMFFSATLIIVALRSAWILYDNRESLRQESQYASQYETQLLGYLEKYYGVETLNLKHSMRPIHTYSFNGTKVKKIWADEFDQPQTAVDNDIIKTPDITNVLYFGKLTLNGQKLDNAVVQLLPDGNIVILHDGIAIEPNNI